MAKLKYHSSTCSETGWPLFSIGMNGEKALISFLESGQNQHLGRCLITVPQIIAHLAGIAGPTGLWKMRFGGPSFLTAPKRSYPRVQPTLLSFSNTGSFCCLFPFSIEETTAKGEKESSLRKVGRWEEHIWPYFALCEQHLCFISMAAKA